MAGMKMNWNGRLRLAIGALLLAMALLAVVTMPGLMSDRDSTVPLQPVREAGR